MNPIVSIILPCFNAHRYLDRAIASARAQTLRDIEIIVVNDGSSDPETLVCLASLPPDVRVIHQENCGLSGARNTGFREARGRFVVPLDCDDWLEPDFVVKALEALKGRDEENCFVFCQLALEGDLAGVLVKNFNFFEQLFVNQLPYCMLISKSLWQRVGGYDENMRLGYEDWEFNIRLGSFGAEATAIPEPLFHYHVSGGGMLQSISRRRHSQLWRAIQAKHRTLYRIRNLVGLWRKWRAQPSTRPLLAYTLLLLGYRVLPSLVFNWLFSKALIFSQSRRIQRYLVGWGDPDSRHVVKR